MKPLAVVTGASSGIGAEFARQLAERGHPVLAVARRAERLAELAAAAQAAGHAPIHGMALDVTAAEAPARVLARARELGGAGWLVNSAGGARLGRFIDGAPEPHAAQVRVNCEALVALSGPFAREFAARGAGVILNVASTAGFQPTPELAVYGATKAFVIAFSEALAEELRTSGVRVTALCPGPVTTEFFDVSGATRARRAPAHEISAAACARFGIEAAERGRVIAVPGAGNKLLAATAGLFPRALVPRVAGRIGLSSLGYARS